MKPDPHTCVVCGAQVQHLPLQEALARGAASQVQIDDGPMRTYYRCPGRHSAEEFLRAINLLPKFVKAGELK